MQKTLLSVAAVASLAIGAGASAQDFLGDVQLSANVAYTTDYRFRGISFSDNNFALQGGFDIETESGFYVGTWTSSLVAGTELDVYGGYAFEAGPLGFDVGVTGYFFPNAGEDTTVYELYGSTTGTVGPVELTGGVALAPEQNSIDETNFYVFLDGGMPITETVSASAHVGYNDGPFGTELVDWSLGADTSALGVDWNLSYIGTSYDDDEDQDGFGESAAGHGVVLTVSKSM